MDPITLVTVAAGVVGIIAGVVAVAQYLEQRRERRQKPPESPISTPTQPRPPVPNNLPPRSEFIGREQEENRLLEALASRSPLVCIDGIGGIGKTSLALEVAYRCLAASTNHAPGTDISTFEGFVWTSAKDRELKLNDILDAVARTLDYPGIAQQPLDNKLESIRKLLQAKRCLLIVDNFETVTDHSVHSFLIHMPEPSKALVTSREQRLPEAWSVSLGEMEQSEALALMRTEGRRLNLVSVEKASDAMLMRIYEATGGAPLAIKWAVGQIKQKGQSLDEVLEAFREAHGDIFQIMFARSWGLLSQDARLALTVMPIFVTSATRTAIEAACNIGHDATNAALGQLVEMRLVEATDDLEVDRRRYSIHPLTRAFAQNQSEAMGEFPRQARERTAAWLAQFAKDNGTQQATYDRLEDELPNTIALMRWCHQQSMWVPLVTCGTALRDFLQARGYWNESLGLGNYVIQAAEKIGDQKSLALACVNPMGWVHRHRGELAEAKSWYEKGIATYLAIGDQDRAAWARLGLASVAWQAGNLTEARTIAEEVEIAYSGQTDALHQSLHAIALVHLSEMATDPEEWARAEELARQALRLAQQTSDEKILVRAQYFLGMAMLRQNRLDEAEACFIESLTINIQYNIRMGIAVCEAGLAEVKNRKGQAGPALEYARAAADLYVRLEMRNELAKLEPLLAQLQKSPAEAAADAQNPK